MVGRPDGRLTTPMSRNNTPPRIRCRAPWSRLPWRQIAWRRYRCGCAPFGRAHVRPRVKMRWMKRSPCRVEHLLDAADVAQVGAQPRIMQLRLRVRGRDPWRRASCVIAFVEPDEHRLADQEMPDVEFDDLRQRRDRLGAGIIEAVPGMHLEAEAAGAARAARGCAAIRRRRRPCRRRPAHRHQAPVWISITGAPSASAASICVGIGGDEQRHPDAGRAAASAIFAARARALPRRRRDRLRWCARRAAPAPGRPHAAGCACAIAIISSVAAISKLSGLAISAFSRAMSSSRIWRRSSRRCAVMPSAPASIASIAARTGSGCRPPRALRIVATWSMLTPRRRCGSRHVACTCLLRPAVSR